jgi:DNA-directed RNA polymerase specialized sigma24 family protein
MLDLIDPQGPDELRELKHVLIPLLQNPSANARRIIRTIATSPWLKRELQDFAKRKVNARQWIGDPNDIVDDFLREWWQRLTSAKTLHYDVARHRALPYWIKRVFLGVIEDLHKEERKISEMEVSIERHLHDVRAPGRVPITSFVTAMEAALGELNEIEKEIFMLKAEGRNAREVGTKLGIKQHRVENVIRAVRKRLAPKAPTFFDM